MPDEPLDFEKTIEAAVLELRKRFNVRACLYDPWQMTGSAQRLSRAGVKMQEFPQSPGNMTEASQHLYELVRGRNLITYPDADIRLAISRAVAVETPRGMRIAKDKQTHKIDVVIALAMAALAAVQRGRSVENGAWTGEECDVSFQSWWYWHVGCDCRDRHLWACRSPRKPRSTRCGRRWPIGGSLCCRSRSLFVGTVGCVHYDGSTMEGHLNYPKGAMGVHFVNLTVQGPPDPLKPNVLIYEPQAGGKLKLVAVEWLVPLAAVKERPTL